MSRRRSFLRDRSGANAVEFALLSVPLLMVLMGTFEFGRMYWAQHVLNEIAAAGARCVGVLQSGCTQNGVYDAASAISYISGRAATDGIACRTSPIAPRRTTRMLAGLVVGLAAIRFRSECRSASAPGFQLWNGLSDHRQSRHARHTP